MQNDEEVDEQVDNALKKLSAAQQNQKLAYDSMKLDYAEIMANLEWINGEFK